MERVDIPASSGDMGILANHVPTIQQLKPGVIDVTVDGSKSKKIFGGFDSHHLMIYSVVQSRVALPS